MILSNKIAGVKALREKTGCGLFYAKKAYEESLGDMEKAEQLIHQYNLSNRSSAALGAGSVFVGGHNNRIGVVLEIHCSTDFGARSGPFQSLGMTLVSQIIGLDPIDVLTLLTSEMLHPAFKKKTVEQVIQETSAQLGESVTIARFNRLEVPAKFTVVGEQK